MLSVILRGVSCLSPLDKARNPGAQSVVIEVGLGCYIDDVRMMRLAFNSSVCSNIIRIALK